jgi:hypothetical protein
MNNNVLASSLRWLFVYVIDTRGKEPAKVRMHAEYVWDGEWWENVVSFPAMFYWALETNQVKYVSDIVNEMCVLSIECLVDLAYLGRPHVTLPCKYSMTDVLKSQKLNVKRLRLF